MTTPSVPTVVFDLGEVLVSSDGLERALAPELGDDAVAARRAYYAHRLRHDLGDPPQRYWATVFDSLGLEPAPERLAAAEALDIAHWSTLPFGSTLMLGELARRRVRLALLSNAPRGLAAAIRAAAWSGPFDRMLFSADLGLAKPSPDIYRRADHEFRTAPEQVVFFDDRAENVRVARAHGWDAHVWQGTADAMATLRSRDIPAPR